MADTIEACSGVLAVVTNMLHHGLPHDSLMITVLNPATAHHTKPAATHGATYYAAHCNTSKGCHQAGDATCKAKKL
jgi:hypothetical protein